MFTPETADSFALSSMGAIGALRSMTKAGKLAVIPCHVGQVGPLIAQGAIPCDVAMVQVSPADDDGIHSFGLISDHIRAMVAKARLVIAEINDQVPYTYGECFPPRRSMLRSTPRARRSKSRLPKSAKPTRPSPATAPPTSRTAR